jgi:alpha-L-rhamnosidase
MPDKQASAILGEKQEGIVIGSGHHEFSCAFEPEKWKPTAIPIPFYVPVKEEPWW